MQFRYRCEVIDMHYAQHDEEYQAYFKKREEESKKKAEKRKLVATPKQKEPSEEEKNENKRRKQEFFMAKALPIEQQNQITEGIVDHLIADARPLSTK